MSQVGLSLIELLVSLLIAGIILAGVLNIAFNAKRSSYDGEQLSFVQDNARFVLDQIKREIRMAGYSGCAGIRSANKANVVVDDLDGFIKLTESIQGFDWESANKPDVFAEDILEGTDAFIVRFADASREYSIRSHSASTATFSLWTSEKVTSGSTMMVADANCREIGLFQVTGPGGDSNTLQHAADGARNCTRVVRATETNSISCADGCTVDSCGANTEKDFNAGSVVMPYEVSAYYIGESVVVADMPALKRQVLTASDGVAATETEEVAVGVEDMQVQYGIDRDDDGEANQYLSAHQVADWAEVVALRLTLIFRSDRDVYLTDQDVTLKVDGDDYKLSEDKLMRQVVSATIKIRNN
ncbi:PilW family protein [Teredinibacter purpureus]|uniref:PilW family protein n=1 Tax=Teredinibacter purpureus TaxID=2731756 RepID=UPI0005F8732B|nr:PilW family protein [Teredinibacter purpureus]